ncbi:hypothetical protein niasHT_014431 [Heterodera trifolii]|uniref:Uncharacterized protein n=1 Tax=Heterodera trifolii TaxID=157864 RepID=A0ABD2L044_9BILA
MLLPPPPLLFLPAIALSPPIFVNFLPHYSLILGIRPSSGGYECRNDDNNIMSKRQENPSEHHPTPTELTNAFLIPCPRSKYTSWPPSSARRHPSSTLPCRPNNSELSGSSVRVRTTRRCCSLLPRPNSLRPWSCLLRWPSDSARQAQMSSVQAELLRMTGALFSLPPPPEVCSQLPKN